jgi:hypothetical protein
MYVRFFSAGRSGEVEAPPTAIDSPNEREDEWDNRIPGAAKLRMLGAVEVAN